MNWWRARSKRTQAILVVVGLLVLYAVVGPKSPSTTSTGSPTPPAASAETTAGGTPTAARTTASPTPTPSPTPSPTPVVLRGRGQTATDLLTLPFALSVAMLTHDGSRNFIVEVFATGAPRADLLVNKIGAYRGMRPLAYTVPVRFDVEADGNWTIEIRSIDCCATDARFEGRGDAVSNLFHPPAAAPWEFSHNGTRNFVVTLQCASGRQIVQNRIGSFSGSTVVTFGRDPCYWEIEADGDWSLRPR
jgi:hypothetical protein